MKYYNFCSKLIDAPHILIAGATGSGKSVLINDMLFSFCTDCGKGARSAQFVLLDPKRVELSPWKNTAFCAGYASDNTACVNLLRGCVSEMERRYKDMERRGIREYDGSDLYIFIDELADLMITVRSSFLPLAQRIAQLGRAAKVHLIAATQSPSRLTIPAALVLNFTHRIALRCDSSIESRQIIGRPGAEDLPRYGKALLKCPGGFYGFDVPLTSEEELTERINYFRAEEKRWNSQKTDGKPAKLTSLIADIVSYFRKKAV